jgi:TonB family protein
MAPASYALILTSCILRQSPRVLEDDGTSPRVVSSDWECRWPDAVPARIHGAFVVLELDVSAAGIPTSIEILRDPGYGFGASARSCAGRMRYRPAVGPDGVARSGRFKLRIHFDEPRDTE